MHNFGTRDRGCSAHPAFPAPSFSKRRNEFAKLGRNAPRGREAMTNIVSRALRSMERQRNDALQTRDPVRGQTWVPALRSSVARCTASGTRDWRLRVDSSQISYKI